MSGAASIFNRLSVDILRHIADYFDCKTSSRVLATSTSLFFDICADPRLWHELLKRYLVFTCPACSAEFPSKLKLKYWIRRCFKVELVGSSQLCPARFLHRSVPCSDGTGYIFGGYGSQSCLNDLWRFSILEDEKRIILTQIPQIQRYPSPRAACSISCIGNYFFLFGGTNVNDNSFESDFWRYSITSGEWVSLRSSRGAPCPEGRWGHVTVTYGNHLFLFGGSCPRIVFNDIWCIDLSNHLNNNNNDEIPIVWEQVIITSNNEVKPKPRGGHSAVVIGNYLYLFGGNDFENTFDDLWRFDLQYRKNETIGWELLYEHTEAVQGPSPRIGHSAVAVGKYMIIVGGRNFFSRIYATGIHIYDTILNEWLQVKYDESHRLLLRSGLCAIPCSSGVIYFGGLVNNENEPCRDVVHLNLFGITDVDKKDRALAQVPPNELVEDTEASSISSNGESTENLGTTSTTIATTTTAAATSAITITYSRWYNQFMNVLNPPVRDDITLNKYILIENI